MQCNVIPFIISQMVVLDLFSSPVLSQILNITFCSIAVGVTTNGSDPKWKTVCVLSGYHNRTIYDVHW